MPAPILINVELKDALTASICSHLTVEFLKHIAYQRQQIPFPYKQLQSVLKRGLEAKTKAQDLSIANGVRSCQALQLENEFRKVNGFMQSMETAFQNLEEEIRCENGMVEEVAMVLGATPLSPKDVYRLQFPPLLHGHIDSKHPQQSSLLELFRCLISSEELHKFFSQPSLPTNMFLFLRKRNTHLATSGFSPKERYNIPSSGKHAIIRLISPSDPPKCICGGSNIYSDHEDDSSESPLESNNHERTHEPEVLLWYQAHHALKGFKDAKINGTSATSVWLQSR